MDAEVLVVGGGPAGLATAIAGRLAGLDVTVVDRGTPPIDKACGEGLMPGAVDRLDALGVHLAAGRPFHGIRWVDGATVAEGRFPGRSGLGVRRPDLHAALVARTEELGVRQRWRTRVLGLTGVTSDTPTVETADGPLQARFVVGADGLHSRVRRWAGLEGRASVRRRFGVRRHLRMAPWSDHVEVHWADQIEAYVTPVADDEVGVALLWSGRKARFDELSRAFPALRRRLDGAPIVSRDRGAGPLHQRPRGVVRGHVALVGDASGYIDAVTGEGLALAFAQAEVLAAALARRDLGAYARQHPGLGRWANGVTELLLGIERRPWLRRRMVRALEWDGALFARLLGVHGGTEPLTSLGAAFLPRLAWALMAARG